MGSFRAVLVPVLVALCASFMSSQRNDDHEIFGSGLPSDMCHPDDCHGTPARYHNSKAVRVRKQQHQKQNGCRRPGKHGKCSNFKDCKNKATTNDIRVVHASHQTSYRSYADAVENGVPLSKSQSSYKNGLNFGTPDKNSFAVRQRTKSVCNASLRAEKVSHVPKSQITWPKNATQSRMNNQGRPKNGSLAFLNSHEQNNSSILSRRHDTVQFKPLIYRHKADKWQYKANTTGNTPNFNNQSDMSTYTELYSKALNELTSNQISSNAVYPNQAMNIDSGLAPASMTALKSTDCVGNDCPKPKVLSPTFILPRMSTDSALRRKLNPNAKPFVPAPKRCNALKLSTKSESLLGTPTSNSFQSPVNPFDAKLITAKSGDIFKCEDDCILSDTMQALGFADNRNKELLNLNHSSQPLGKSEAIRRATQRSATHARTVGAKPQHYAKTNILQTKSLRPSTSTTFDNRCGTNAENIPKSLTQAFDSADNDIPLDQQETNNHSSESSYSFKERFGYSGWQ